MSDVLHDWCHVDGCDNIAQERVAGSALCTDHLRDVPRELVE